MKKILTICFFLLFFPSFSFAASLTKPPNNLGLVGYWSFNEGTSTKAVDYSGNGNLGTLTNMAAPASVTSGWTSTGKVAGALNFDGTDDYVNIPDNNAYDFGTGNFTISWWQKWNSLSNYQSVYDHGYSSNLLIQANTGSGLYLVYMGGAGAVTETSSTPTLGVWYHYTLTRSGTTVTLYRNGVSAGTGTNSTNLSSASAVMFGGGTGGGGYPTNGSLDELRIYNRALSGTEITALYNTTNAARVNSSFVNQGTSLDQGLLAYWTLDNKDMLNGVLLDKSGNGFNGNLINIATSTFYTIGKFGQAFNFDGTDDYVNIPGNVTPSFGPSSNVTLSTWVKVNALDGVAKGFLENILAANDFTIALTMDASNRWVCGLAKSTVTNQTVTSAGVANIWTHLAVTYNGSLLTCYVNGVSVGTDTASAGTLTANPVSLGWAIGATRYDGTTFNPHAGQIDESRIYNRALSASEIRQLYGRGTGRTNVSQNISGGSLDSGLVGMWSFNGADVVNGVAIDRSSSGNNGNFKNIATSTFYAIGKVGQAINLDGSNDYVAVPNGGGLNNTQTGSIAMWVKWSGTQDSSPYGVNGAVSGRQKDGTFSEQVIGLSGTNPVTATVVWQPYCANCVVITGTTAVGDGRWRHVVVTYSSGSHKLYVDGVLEGTSATTGTISNDSSVIFAIGGWINNSGSPYTILKGGVDEVRIYNRVLSAAEVKQLYNLGK